MSKHPIGVSLTNRNILGLRLESGYANELLTGNILTGLCIAIPEKPLTDLATISNVECH